MVDIVDGRLITCELTEKSNGGTEQMARRMINLINPDLLQDVQIVHSRIRNLDPNKKKIFVAHDLANDPEVKDLANPEFRKQFSKIVFVSNWQLQQYNMILGLPYKESKVIHNAIEPVNPPLEKWKSLDAIRIVYCTTPHRGLGILVPVFERLVQILKSEGFERDIHLDVYSSFGIYGWEERNKPYEDLFEKCRRHPNITYHGFVDNATIREKLKETHIYAYPSIWPETSGISVIEAMMFSNIVVCPNYAALPETVSSFGVMYDYTEDHQEHAYRFINQLYSVIKHMTKNPETYEIMANMANSYANTAFSTKLYKANWENLLREVKSA